MKFIDGIVISEVGGRHVLVAVGQAAKTFSGMVTLNGTAAFLADLLFTETTEQQMLERLLEEYDVDRETGAASVSKVVSEFSNLGILV